MTRTPKNAGRRSRLLGMLATVLVSWASSVGASEASSSVRGDGFALTGFPLLERAHLSSDRTVRLTGAITAVPPGHIFSDGFESGSTGAWVFAPERPRVPSGTMLHFELSQCPSGWSAANGVGGRAVVGRPSPGSVLGGTVWVALLDQQVTTHRSHPVDMSGTTGGHGTLVSAHRHAWSHRSGGTYTSFKEDGASVTTTTWSNGMDSDGSGNYPYIGRDNVSSYTETVESSNSDAHRHDLDLGTVYTQNAPDGHLPYLQLLLCEKD